MLVVDDDTRRMWAAQARKERVKATIDFIGSIFAAVFILVVAWLFILITPDQKSAECEAIEEQLQR